MLFLVLSVLCSALVIHTFRYAQGKGLSVDRLLLVNYLMATATGWVQVAVAPNTAPESSVTGGLAALVGLALVTGALFIGNFYLLGHAVSRLGPSLAGAASRMSAVLPVALSVVVFAEVPGPWSWAGIALALAALPLSFPKAEPTTVPQTRAWLPALAVFVGFGVNDFTLKVQNNLFPAGTKPLFLALVYTVALAVALARWWWTRRVPGDGHVWVAGAVLGLANYLSALFFSWALGQLPGSQAYALVRVGVNGVVTLTSLVLWKERLTWRSAAFLSLAAVSIGLIQLA